HLDFLDLDGLLLLARLGGFLLRHVFLLAEFDDLANRYVTRGMDLYEVKAKFFGQHQRLFGRHDAMVLAFGINELDGRGPDILVRAGAFVGGWRRSKWSANGFGLLINSFNPADCGVRA